ncbi:MAG: PqqD family protein [Nitrospira sp.]|nr:PqqD family protein [Nitrospira sp.]
MGRQPFITADLRPDMTVEADPGHLSPTGHAATAQLAEAARAMLSEGEQQQVERGRQDTRQDLMSAVPRPNPDVQGTTLDGETVLLDLGSGRYYTLNRVGTAIWDACTGTASLQAIHTALCGRFDAPPERIADDLFALVTHLSHEGLLTIERG